VPRLKLYARSQCPLCEEMARELAARGIAFQKIDVDSDLALLARYGKRVPVLVDEERGEIALDNLR
jgi:glutaredoxin